ncbi:hypothetical protein CQW23_17049 [Capsicum baccatum]|uniref:Pentatricopeptide repeat-containing protein n=1 Tax=Capsicum baccatum TaxID=33114 RepID=A0A2G2WCN9_CAPBA|nr:hypothetical protein CQW23_17049 [Capsicum baccatum]
MWRIFHTRITKCIQQNTFQRHYCQNNLILVQEIIEILKNNKWKSLIQSSGLIEKLNPDLVQSVLHEWSKHKVGIQSELEIHSFLAALLCSSSSNNLYGPANSVLDTVIKFGLPPLDIVKSIDNCRKEFDESRKFDHVIFGLLMDKYREKGYLFEAAIVIFAHNKDLDCVPSFLYCNRLLMDLLKVSNFRLFWRVINAMREANVTFSDITYTCMVGAHCREGNVNDAKKVFAEMKKKGHCPNMFTYNYLIKGLFRAGHVDEAIELKKSMSLVPNIYIYTTIIRGLCVANKFREATMVLAEMSERGVKPNAVVYQVLIDCYLRHDDVDEAFKMKDIKDAIGIDLVMCNTFLRGLCKCGKMEKAYELVDEMTREGIEPDLKTYTLLIEGHCREGNVATVLELLEEMKKKNLAPVESTYCMITNCFCRNKDPDSVIASLPDLITKNGKRNAHTWRTLLMNYSCKGNLQQLRRILEVMHEQGIIPATPHYNILIKGLCRTWKMKVAQSCLVEMLDRGLKPDQEIYEAFIIGYCGKGELQNAEKYLCQMLHHGFKPNKAIYSALISVNCKSGKVSEAFGAFRSMLSLDLLKVCEAYPVLLRSLLTNGKMLEAAEVISELHGKNLVADVSAYEALICYFAQHSEIEKAFTLYEESQNKGIRLNLRTRNHLIVGLFRAGQTERAKIIFEIILKEGLGPNREICTTMISGLAKGGLLSEAFGLFHSMILRGLSPRRIIYNALLDGCCKTGNLQKAQDLLQEMFQMGIASTKDFNTLIDGFLKNGNVVETKQLLKKMIEGCVELDQDTYTMLIEQLCKDGLMEEAEMLISEMQKRDLVP